MAVIMPIDIIVRAVAIVSVTYRRMNASIVVKTVDIIAVSQTAAQA